MSLFDGVVSQHIDKNGKTRVLNYKNVSLVVSPLPPLDIPEVGGNSTNVADLKTVLKFIKSNNLEVVEQNGDESSQKIEGLWVRCLLKPNPIAYGYIPIQISTGIADVPYTDEQTIDPLFVGETSELDNMRNLAKVAEYLKQHSIYLCSIADDAEEWIQRGVENYYISSSHTYDLSKVTALFDTKNKVFYKDGKLIVNDKETARRLVRYVKVSIFNDITLLSRYKTKTHIDTSVLFVSIDDFRKENKQLIFMGKNALLQWKLEKSRQFSNSTVHTTIQPYAKEPYYYRNLKIRNGRLMIIQNTKGTDYLSALYVAKEWMRLNVNIGYDVDVTVDDVGAVGDYIVYDSSGVVSTKGSESNDSLSIMYYNDGSYGAILFL